MMLQDVQPKLVITVICVVGLTWALWLVYAWQSRRLKVRIFDQTSFYSFMVAVDFAMILKWPTLTLIDGDVMNGREGTRVFVFLAFATFALGLLAIWIDSKAERVLQAHMESAARARREQGTGFIAKLRGLLTIRWDWYLWRWCQRGLLMILSTVHTAALAMVSKILY